MAEALLGATTRQDGRRRSAADIGWSNDGWSNTADRTQPETPYADFNSLKVRTAATPCNGSPRTPGAGDAKDIDSPTKWQVGAAQDAADEVDAHALHNRLRHQIERMRSFRELPLYMVFLVMMTCMIGISRLQLRYNELFHLEQANRKELELDKFLESSTPEEFWDWLENIAGSLVANNQTSKISANSTGSTVPQRRNYPIGVLMLRQWRVRDTDCIRPGALTQKTRDSIPVECSPEWDDDTLSVTPYGPAGRFVPQKASKGVLPSVNTQYHDFDNKREQCFQEVLDYHISEADFVGAIHGLHRDAWFDHATRLVLVDILTYNPALEAFELNHLYLETFATGATVPAMHAYPFNLYHWDTHLMRFMFACDVCLAVWTVFMTLAMLIQIKHRRFLRYKAPYLGFWGTFDCLFLSALVLCVYNRVWLWTTGPLLHAHDEFDPHNGSEMKMFEDLFLYGLHFNDTNTWQGLTVGFVWLRLFRYMRFHSYLGVMSATVRRAWRDLLSMVAIFTIVLAAFSVSGTSLYGVDHVRFSTWTATIATLIKMLVSGEVQDQYDEMINIHPNITPAFLSGFMIVAWFLGLNMVLAVINAAFFAVQERRRRAGTSEHGMGHIAGGYITSISRICSQLRDSGKDALLNCVKDEVTAGHCEKRMLAMQYVRDLAHRKEASGKKKDGEADPEKGEGVCLRAHRTALRSQQVDRREWERWNNRIEDASYVDEKDDWPEEAMAIFRQVQQESDTFEFDTTNQRLGALRRDVLAINRHIEQQQAAQRRSTELLERLWEHHEQQLENKGLMDVHKHREVTKKLERCLADEKAKRQSDIVAASKWRSHGEGAYTAGWLAGHKDGGSQAKCPTPRGEAPGSTSPVNPPLASLGARSPLTANPLPFRRQASTASTTVERTGTGVDPARSSPVAAAPRRPSLAGSASPAARHPDSDVTVTPRTAPPRSAARSQSGQITAPPRRLHKPPGKGGASAAPWSNRDDTPPV